MSYVIITIGNLLLTFTIIQTQVIYIGLQIRPLKNENSTSIHQKVPTH